MIELYLILLIECILSHLSNHISHLIIQWDLGLHDRIMKELVEAPMISSRLLLNLNFFNRLAVNRNFWLCIIDILLKLVLGVILKSFLHVVVRGRPERVGRKTLFRRFMLTVRYLKVTGKTSCRWGPDIGLLSFWKCLSREKFWHFRCRFRFWSMWFVWR